MDDREGWAHEVKQIWTSSTEENINLIYAASSYCRGRADSDQNYKALFNTAWELCWLDEWVNLNLNL